MTALADMEELLSRISNKAVLSFMREALGCYGASAYRGCIVLSYLALFDDLKLKLAELAKINGIAKDIWKEVEKRSGNQEVFESYMADQLLSKDLITKAEHTQLQIVRDIRNRAAHPSGVEATAEEARYIFRAVIDQFLSRQVLKTTHAADALIVRLGMANLFPGADFDAVAALVQSELTEFHPAAYPYLIRKLVEARPDPARERNAGRFLAGLAVLNDQAVDGLLRKLLLEDRSADPEYWGWIGRVIAANGTLLKGISAAATLRIRAMLEADAEGPSKLSATALGHPARRLSGMLAGLGETAVLASYRTFAETVVDHFPYAPPLLKALANAPELRGRAVALWIERARSSQWADSNPLATAAPVLDEFAEGTLTDETAFGLIVALVEGADWGARIPRRLRAEHFVSMPKIREMALRHAIAEPAGSEKVVKAAMSDTDLASFLRDELSDAEAEEVEAS